METILYIILGWLIIMAIGFIALKLFRIVVKSFRFFKKGGKIQITIGKTQRDKD